MKSNAGQKKSSANFTVRPKTYGPTYSLVTRFMKDTGLLRAWKKYVWREYRDDYLYVEEIDQVVGMTAFTMFLERSEHVKKLLMPFDRYTTVQLFRIWLYMMYPDEIINGNLPIRFNDINIKYSTNPVKSIGLVLRALGVNESELYRKTKDVINVYNKLEEQRI